MEDFILQNQRENSEDAPIEVIDGRREKEKGKDSPAKAALDGQRSNRRTQSILGRAERNNHDKGNGVDTLALHRMNLERPAQANEILGNVASTAERRSIFTLRRE